MFTIEIKSRSISTWLDAKTKTEAKKIAKANKKKFYTTVIRNDEGKVISTYN